MKKVDKALKVLDLAKGLSHLGGSDYTPYIPPMRRAKPSKETLDKAYKENKNVRYETLPNGSIRKVKINKEAMKNENKYKIK